jgi:hypothetical protein
MLLTLSAILTVLWLIGIGSSHMLGGFIHVLAALAVLALLFDGLTGGWRSLPFLRRREEI